MRTYVEAKNALINFKISVSLLLVSSKPGVSIKVTQRPSNSKGSDKATVSVHECKLLPTRRLEPLSRLINCSCCQSSYSTKFDSRLTVDFPLPVAPITLNIIEDQTLRTEVR